MPKTFYTEHDIEDMMKRGVMSIEMTDDVVLTDLAYERARKLGLKLVTPGAETPPAAPVRPYIVKSQVLPSQPTPASQAFGGFNLSQAVGTPKPDAGELRQRIHNAVTARLGAQVDSSLLDAIINRVLSSTGIK